MKKVLAIITTISCLFLGVRSHAAHKIENVQLEKVRTRDQGMQWRVTFSTDKPAKSVVLIYDQNLELVRQLHGDDFIMEHKALWDGRNEDGEPVSPQLYFYRVQTTDEEGIIAAVDEVLRTAAQDTLTYWPKWEKEQQKIRFELERDALVRTRVGIKDGPMVATPAEWVPVYREAPEVAWDGMDDAGVQNYSDADNLKIHTDAISLPENHILVAREATANQPDYARGEWIASAVAFNEQIKPRDYRLASSIVKDRRRENTSVRIKTPYPLDDQGRLVVRRKTPITIVFPKFDEDERDSQFYETLYYVDGMFEKEDNIFAEDTTEFTLIPAVLGKGEHLFVVNAVLGSSWVGTSSLRIYVP